MTELDLIIDLHKNSERQGPGSDSETLRALELINLPYSRKLKVVDIGSGSGGQTITLAQNINGVITAVDIFSVFLDELNKKSKNLDLTDKIITLEKSMDDLSFSEQEFDIIWSEGAIYNIGFENGIRQWKKFLKMGGYLAISDITWISNTRPKEIEDFWAQECPDIDIASNKIKILEDNGYSLAGYFIVSQDSWIENYYKPLKAKFEHFLEHNNNTKLARKVVEDYKTEIDIYEKYKDYFSYGFYVAMKNE